MLMLSDLHRLGSKKTKKGGLVEDYYTEFEKEDQKSLSTGGQS